MQIEDNLPSILTAKEAARILRVSEGTLANWRVTGDGPPWRKIRGSVRYTKAEVLDWFNAHPSRQAGGAP